MTTVNARKIVDSIVRNRKQIFKDAALVVAVSELGPWCEGAQNTVLVTIRADWFGSYTIRCEHDREVWTVSVSGGHRLNPASVAQFDEMVDALRIVNAVADKIDSSIL